MGKESSNLKTPNFFSKPIRKTDIEKTYTVKNVLCILRPKFMNILISIDFKKKAFIYLYIRYIDTSYSC